MQTLLKAKLERRSSNGTKYLVIWWMSKSPYAAVFTNRVAAEAAANVRNAILVAIKGHATKVEEVVDWYRRDDEGRPMPAEWREVMGQGRLPWGTVSADPAHENQTDLTKTSDPAEAGDAGRRNGMGAITATGGGAPATPRGRGASI